MFFQMMPFFTYNKKAAFIFQNTENQVRGTPFA